MESTGSGGDGGPRESRPRGDDGREETEEERADRRWNDLLQELRVAQTGVQILFGFLLAVVFQPRFTTLSDLDRGIYVVTVLLGSATVAALIGPVFYHRLLTGRRVKPQTVRWASRVTVVGLVLLFFTMCSALLLILRVALHDSLALWLVGAMALWFLVCWFVAPLRARARSSGPRPADHSGPGGPPGREG
ncbi:DUF6328 family protein [Streptomyces fulvorobeus]|uniref:Small-conductance mechanosensitive channel n=1 Tax=Streptomyces fulvorobeus TaxID=284028 RepID=A0A7J0BZ02_9ACTN|nr:DUF6328 family protein [Streptomyces fulvorobeus]NYE39243.1 small-conductance mechanosensitive channel [Streptomyces fulvorobeus]GFM95451.1 hypothetical protein Sfulv_02620 [Streptomyces fulvorobeus]